MTAASITNSATDTHAEGGNAAPHGTANQQQSEEAEDGKTRLICNAPEQRRSEVHCLP